MRHISSSYTPTTDLESTGEPESTRNYPAPPTLPHGTAHPEQQRESVAELPYLQPEETVEELRVRLQVLEDAVSSSGRASAGHAQIQTHSAGSGINAQTYPSERAGSFLPPPYA